MRQNNKIQVPLKKKYGKCRIFFTLFKYQICGITFKDENHENF